MKGVVALIFLLITISCKASDPDCDGINNWAAKMAFVHLKNVGITDSDEVDFSLTQVKRLASEKIGEDLYRQIHLVTYIEKSGREIKTITSNNASSEECSMSGVRVYVISRELGDKSA